MSDNDLFGAAQRGDRDALRQILWQLLQKDAFASCSAIESALEVAIWNDHGDIVREMMRLAGHVCTYVTRGRHLILTARRGSTAAAYVLCSGRTSFHWRFIQTALVWAAVNGDVATAALLIPFVTRSDLLTSAMSVAAKYGQTRTIRKLIGCRVDVNSQVFCKWKQTALTALHSAARSGQTKVLKQLLHFKADNHKRTARGHTALDLANEEGHVATAAMLRRRGNSLSVTCL